MKRYIPLLIFAAFAVLFANRLINPRVMGTIDSPLIGKPIPDLGFKHLPDGPFILNFFASWCAPCVVEHPHLMDLRKSGIVIVGVAFKDTPENIDVFLKDRGNPYKFILADSGDGPAIIMGITGVPESYAIDANHIVRARIQGPLEDPRVIAQFKAAVQP